MISAVIFDFDGTLVDSNAIKLQGFYDAVAAHPGGSTRMATVINCVKGDRAAIFSAYVADAESRGWPLAPDAASALVRGYSERVDSLVAGAEAMPGALSLLEQLRRRRLRVFLSSATPITSLKNILEGRKWLTFFEGIFGHPATKRESVMNVLRVTGIEPASLAVVGDGEDDRECAAWAGCAFYPVGEARGISRSEKVFTLTELHQILLGHVN